MLSDHIHQDIARSSYADMLNDDERNRAYNNAIEFSVTYLVTSKVSNPDGNRFFKCCDIGTGSGLLSMMIVRSFKKLNYEKFHIQAFEAFQPMAECAKRVIELNGMSEHITVIPTRSDLYKAEQSPQYDLLVAELLDTELIGEGCLEVYRHAIQNLCAPNCLFVPHAAHIYLEPVASARLFTRHAIDDLEYTLDTRIHVKVNIADEIKNCPGMPEIDDMQVSALNISTNVQDLIRFSRPQMAFEFIFGNFNSLKLSDYKKLTFPIEKRITEPPVLVMWWDITMYDSSVRVANSMTLSKENHHYWEILSCAPIWARNAEQLARDQYIKQTYGRDVWREHWIQGVYYFSSVSETRALIGRPSEEELVIHAYHDSFSLWFDLKECKTKLPNNCDCGFHRKLSRSQLAFLSDLNQMASLIRSSLYPLFCTRAQAEEEVTILGEIEFQCQQGVALGDTVMPSNNGMPKWKILFRPPPAVSHGRESIAGLTDLALASEIPWSNIIMKYLEDGDKLPEPVIGFEIKFTQVQFDNLNRIRTNIRECEGFNLSDLDDMINYSSKCADKELEAHYLWEYPCTRIDSADYTVFSSSNSHDDQKDLEREKINLGTYWRHFSLPILSQEQKIDEAAGAEEDCNSWRTGWALVFWAELWLKHTNEILSLGPLPSTRHRDVMQTMEAPFLGQRIEWNRNCKQLVYFLHDHPTSQTTAVSKTTDEQPSIHLDVGLNKCQLIVQRAVDYNTSPLKSKRALETSTN